jgi:hypothetical protein
MSNAQTPFTAEPAATPAPSPEAVTPVADPQPVATPTPIVPDAIAHLVGEGKKYASLDVAIAAIAPSQAHIDKIEAENGTLREANEKSRSQEDILTDWQKQIADQGNPIPTPQPAATPAPSTEAIGQIVTQQMQAQAAEAAALANTKVVTAAMTEHYGTKEKAEAAYIEQAKEMGLGVSGLNGLSAQSPKAVLKMLGITQQSSPSPTPSRGSVNTEAFNQTPEPAAPKSVMAGASHKQQMAAWNSHAPKEQ